MSNLNIGYNVSNISGKGSLSCYNFDVLDIKEQTITAYMKSSLRLLKMSFWQVIPNLSKL